MSRPMDALGGTLARYGLVVVPAWFGLLKFMAYEAQGIEPLVSDSPLMSWLYGVFSVTTFSSLLGVFELAAAVLIAVKPWWPWVSALGSLLAIVLFTGTISFLFTTPGVTEATAGEVPRPVDHGRVPDQGRGTVRRCRVDAVRRAPSNPQPSLGQFTGRRRVAMSHWAM
jgi:uncharacterized membrane protein YkgB